jgi:peptide/nickel transport system ATP-binding protein
MNAVLTLSDLCIRLPAGADRDYAVHGLDLELRPKEILCLVGESGSGKSMVTSAILGLLPPGARAERGSIDFEGGNLLALSQDALRQVRGARIGMIFQEPMTALNPLHTIGDQLAEMFQLHTNLGKAEIRRRVLALLADVRIPDPKSAAAAYPHELSGGQRQRAMIAMALALEPVVLIADEPTTALDVTTQAQILALIRELQQKKGTAVLFITHDFGVVAEIADRVAVMRQGVLVEEGAAAQVLGHPRHAYTQSLLAAVPALAPPAPRAQASGDVVLAVNALNKTFGGKSWWRQHRQTRALSDVSLALTRGSTLGIVGESGSGKSTLARCLVRLLESDSGEIRLDGKLLAGTSARARREQASHMQMVFQDPHGSLNPRRRVGELIAQGPLIHGVPAREASARAVELLELVGLGGASAERYPHEFSGGQRQRIGLARALALRPQVLIADEPVSALDVSVQAQVLALLASLRDRFGLSLVFITHDLRVAAQICDHVAVMKDGVVVETGTAVQVFGAPVHPYTRQLLASVPGRQWSAGHGAAASLAA